MPDLSLSGSPAAAALSGSDLFYVVQTPGSGGEKATLTQLLTLVGTSYVAKSGGTMTGALTIASGTLTASAPALNISQTWNGSGVSFRAIDVNITNTLSGLSYPIVVSVSGSNVFYVSSGGDTYTGNYRVTSNGGSYGLGASTDVILYRDATAVLALRNGTNAQALRVYNTTDSGNVNYERGVMDWNTTTNSLIIGMQKGGTGASRQVELVSPFGIYVGSATGVTHWMFDSGNSAALRPNTTNLYDIGSSSLRVRYGYFATAVAITAVAFASLPSAATATSGARATINNCSHATFGTAADGGGSTTVPVWSNGTSWLVG